MLTNAFPMRDQYSLDAASPQHPKILRAVRYEADRGAAVVWAALAIGLEEADPAVQEQNPAGTLPDEAEPSGLRPHVNEQDAVIVLSHSAHPTINTASVKRWIAKHPPDPLA